ncbi:Fe2+-dicitrate sensor, membrane component [Methylophilaceae bacterium 11]|nr:Fe2+-dicitrate sensor, membrane component [Methylophilaceae bacterium 11]
MTSLHQSYSTDTAIVEQAIQWHMQLHDAAADEFAAVQSAFETWLASNAAHAIAYQRVQSMWQQFNVETIAEAKPLIESNLAATEFLKKKKSARKAAKSIAAMLVVGLSAALVYHTQQIKPTWVAQYQTPIGQQKTIDLPDHSKLVINTDTVVNILYSAHQREIVLEHGELFIQVAKDTGRPLVVSTADGTAQALGTQFSVYRKNEQRTKTQVAVLESQVKACNLQRWYQLNSAHCVVVSAGESIEITPQNVSPKQSVDVSQMNAWVSGKLLFDNAPLISVIQQLQRYSPIPITLIPQVAQLRVSGVFPADNVNRSLELLANRLPIQVTQEAQGIVVHPRKLTRKQ